MKTVKILLNVGMIDQHTLGLEEAYQEGAIVSLEDAVADRLILRNIAKEYDATVKKEDEAARKAAHEAAVAAALPDAERELAVEAAKAEAAKRAKAGPSPTAAPTAHSEDSPVSDSNVGDAVAAISTMRSKDKLQHIIDNDPRVSVKEAAKKRLESL